MTYKNDPVWSEINAADIAELKAPGGPKAVAAAIIEGGLNTEFIKAITTVDKTISIDEIYQGIGLALASITAAPFMAMAHQGKLGFREALASVALLKTASDAYDSSLNQCAAEILKEAAKNG